MTDDILERDAGGKFAERTATAKVAPASRRGFQKGEPKPQGSGRRKGTPNKTTRHVKEFLAMLVDDGEVQGAVRARVVKGDTIAFFRAVDHTLGRPKENVELQVGASQDLMTLLLEGRARAAKDEGK